MNCCVNLEMITVEIIDDCCLLNDPVDEIRCGKYNLFETTLSLVFIFFFFSRNDLCDISI